MCENIVLSAHPPQQRVTGAGIVIVNKVWLPKIGLAMKSFAVAETDGFFFLLYNYLSQAGENMRKTIEA
jgi:hypothetical protein